MRPRPLNAIRVPSGDHVGSSSRNWVPGMCVAGPPAAAMIEMPVGPAWVGDPLAVRRPRRLPRRLALRRERDRRRGRRDGPQPRRRELLAEAARAAADGRELAVGEQLGAAALARLEQVHAPFAAARVEVGVGVEAQRLHVRHRGLVELDRRRPRSPGAPSRAAARRRGGSRLRSRSSAAVAVPPVKPSPLRSEREWSRSPASLSSTSENRSRSSLVEVAVRVVVEDRGAHRRGRFRRVEAQHGGVGVEARRGRHVGAAHARGVGKRGPGGGDHRGAQLRRGEVRRDRPEVHGQAGDLRGGHRRAGLVTGQRAEQVRVDVRADRRDRAAAVRGHVQAPGLEVRRRRLGEVLDRERVAQRAHRLRRPRR